MTCFDFDEYYADPFVGPYALKKVSSCLYYSTFRLCDGGLVGITRTSAGWIVDDFRRPFIFRGRVRKVRVFSRYGNAVAYVVKLNVREIEKILVLS